MLNKIDDTLRKDDVPEEFVRLEGIKTLSNWLSVMSDDPVVYPNQKIVYTILQCIDRLPTEKDDETTLKPILELYMRGAGGQAYEESHILANAILNKWYSKKKFTTDENQAIAYE